MRVGIIGAGLMGSNVARCLFRKGFIPGLYNRTKSKAVELARELGADVYSTPGDLMKHCDIAVAFVPDDYALRSVAISVAESAPYRTSKLFVNASTVTPMASIEVWKLLETRGIHYVEAPVYGSADEARECKLVSVIACRKDIVDKAVEVAKTYSIETVYVGEPPKAITVKLALNNIGLAFPALLAESLMLLEAWGVNIDVFLEVSRKLWFGSIIERYWERITTEKPPRFKLWMVGKDYWCIASALKAKGLPAYVSSAISALYYTAASNSFKDKDYPQVAKYCLELAKRAKQTDGP